MDNVEDKKEEKVLVDKQEVTQEKLQELKNRPDIRLHQESENSFRTLNRIRG